MIEKQDKNAIFLAVYAGPKAKEYAMGLDEDGGEIDIHPDMYDDKKRLARLKAEIEAGYLPVVYNRSGSSEPVYTLGDVQKLGWMDKEYITDRITGEVEGWTRYYHKDAPGAIRVYTKGLGKLELWEPGHISD